MLCKPPKDAPAKGDYKAGIERRTGCVQARQGPGSRRQPRKKDELTKNWASVSESFPKSLGRSEEKTGCLPRTARSARGHGQGQACGAKTQYDPLKQGWSDAAASFQQGNLLDAVEQDFRIEGCLAKAGGDARYQS